MAADGSTGLGTRLGRWRLESLLGEGATARVWSARHIDLPRRAAVKVLRSNFADDPVSRLRFAREAEVVAQVRHPGVVPLFDAGIEDDRAYVVMDLVEGESLAARIARDGPIDALRAAALARDLAAALSAVHARGVLHRDVKPANVLLARGVDGVERPVLVDFGAAFLLRADASEAPLTLRGELVGTPAYMAPEQAEGARVDERADVYAIGVLLYECLTGRRPFDGPSWQATLLAVARGRCPSPRALTPSVPPGLDAIVRRAMQRTPDARFPSSAALRDALDAFLAAPQPRARYMPVFTACAVVALATSALVARSRHAPTSLAAMPQRPPPPTPAPALAPAAAPEREEATPSPHATPSSDAGVTRAARRHARRPERGTRGALILPSARVIR